jgi:hypothetical protein
MSLFELYFKLGLQHIADLKGYDHILFILTLCVVYHLSAWKRVLVLVTAFTIGHSLTLALANMISGQQKVTSTLHYVKYSRREWHVLLSGAGMGISLVLMIERFPG